MLRIRYPYYFFIKFTLIIFLSKTAYSQSIVIGGPPIQKEVNFLLDRDSLSEVVRDSVCSAAIKPNGDLRLFSQLKVELGLPAIKIRLKDNAIFSNGSEVSNADLMWSIERCRLAGKFFAVNQVSIFAEQIGSDYAKGILMNLDQAQEAEKVITELKDCPIIEKKSAEIFASDLGQGTSVVCAGEYVISAWKVGRNVSLQRISKDNLDKAPLEVELIGIQNDDEGLRLLRSGKLTMLFTEDDSVLEKSQSDTTLKSGKCGSHRWIARQDFKYDCSQTFSLSSVG